MSGFQCLYCNLTTPGLDSSDWAIITSPEHTCFSAVEGNVVIDDNNVLYVEDTNSGTETVDSNIECGDDNLRPELQSEDSGWKEEAVLLLIEKFENNKSLLEKKNSVKKHVWKKISEEMKQYGYNFSWDRLQNKWKSLVRTYKSIRDNNNQSGRDRKNWTFYVQMDHVMATDPTVDPPVICHNGKTLRNVTNINKPSTSNLRNLINMDRPSASTSPNETDHNLSEDQEQPIQPSKTKQKKQDNVRDIFRMAIEQQQKQHEEDLQEKRRFNELLSSLITSIRKE